MFIIKILNSIPTWVYEVVIMASSVALWILFVASFIK